MPIIRIPVSFNCHHVPGVSSAQKNVNSTLTSDRKKTVTISLEFLFSFSANKVDKTHSSLRSTFAHKLLRVSSERNKRPHSSNNSVPLQTLDIKLLNIKNPRISGVQASMRIVNVAREKAPFKRGKEKLHSSPQGYLSENSKITCQLPVKQDNHGKELPISYFYIKRLGYSLAYNAQHRTPDWVCEDLSKESIKKNTRRKHLKVKEDKSIPEHLRAIPADYRGSGFDRGHMAPTANHRSQKKAMHDTFYMTNMCPQNPKFNSGYWAKFEKHVRDLTEYNQSVYVVTGPLYLPYSEGIKRYVKYQVIGKNDVAVPTHFFKVITLESKQDKKECRAYILPNTEIPFDTPLEQFRTTVQKVEKAAGIVLPK